MKVPLLIALLFTAVFCRPARKVSVSSSESSEEVVKRPRPALRRQAALSLSQSSSVQHVSVSSNSDDSSEASEEQHVSVSSNSDDSSEASEEQVAVSVQMKSAADVISDSLADSVSDSVSATSSTSASTQNPDSGDSDDDDDDDDDIDSEESETEESESSESSEASTVSTATMSPVIVTDDVTTATIVEKMTPDPFEPTIITDDTADSGRGDSLGSYPSEYKTIVYVEDKSYNKLPEPHKSWDYTSKKSAYEPAYGNEVHKTFKIYKGVQVHQELLEEDTSTPEVETQDLNPRQASLDTESSHSQSDSTSDSSGTTEEEQTKVDSISSDSTHEESTSTHEESSEGESESVSSEEATATPGAADSQSDESDSDESLSEEEALQPDLTTDLPVVITAK